ARGKKHGLDQDRSVEYEQRSHWTPPQEEEPRPERGVGPGRERRRPEVKVDVCHPVRVAERHCAPGRDSLLQRHEEDTPTQRGENAECRDTPREWCSQEEGGEGVLADGALEPGRRRGPGHRSHGYHLLRSVQAASAPRAITGSARGQDLSVRRITERS